MGQLNKSIMMLIFVSHVIHPITEMEFWAQYSLTDEQKEPLKRPEAHDKTISVIVPCYYKHARYLPSLLRMYENQTKLPDEVIISLSEIQRVDLSILRELQGELWAFPVVLIGSERVQSAGENRNIAGRAAWGDVLVCQDADDIPHRQRIEVISYFFNTYDVDHLMHRFNYIQMGSDSAFTFEEYPDLSQIQFVQMNDWKTALQGRFLTNGNISIARHVFEILKWPDKNVGEDIAFNDMAYYRFRHCIALRCFLYGYRQYLSSSSATELNDEEVYFQKTSNEIVEKKYRMTMLKYPLIRRDRPEH